MGDDTREQAEPGPTPYDAYDLLVRMIKEVKRMEKEIIRLKAAVNTCLIDAREASARKDEEIERLKEENAALRDFGGSAQEGSR